MSEPRTILAFDFGLRRIGVAVGQDITGSASPLGVVANRVTVSITMRSQALIKEWRPTGIVVGMPSHADGTRSDMQGHVDAFIDELQRYGLAVDTVDERHTSSVEAEQRPERGSGSWNSRSNIEGNDRQRGSCIYR